MDIIEPECTRTKDIVRIDRMNAPHFSVNFDMTVRIIDIKKHDPPGGWKKKFEFGKFAMKNKQPENDKNTDSRVAQTWIS